MVGMQPSSEANNVFLCEKQLEDNTTRPILKVKEANCKPDEESCGGTPEQSVNFISFGIN